MLCNAVYAINDGTDGGDAVTLAEELGYLTGTEQLKIYMIDKLTYYAKTFSVSDDCIYVDNGNGLESYLMIDKIISIEIINDEN